MTRIAHPKQSLKVFRFAIHDDRGSFGVQRIGWDGPDLVLETRLFTGHPHLGDRFARDLPERKIEVVLYDCVGIAARGFVVRYDKIYAHPFALDAQVADAIEEACPDRVVLVNARAVAMTPERLAELNPPT
ncbi:MAG TPA: hypothetical protein VIJ33_10750 [Solirubrobacteraceae bacterium]